MKLRDELDEHKDNFLRFAILTELDVVLKNYLDNNYKQVKKLEEQQKQREAIAQAEAQAAQKKCR